MNIFNAWLERVRDFSPDAGTARFIWTIGGWIVILFILGNTVYATSLAIAQLRDITDSQAREMSDLRDGARKGENLTSVEKRQMLATAKAYVIVHGPIDTDFSLVFIRRSGDWALLEVVPVREDAEPLEVLMYKAGLRWEARAIGTSFPEWSDQASGLFGAD